MAICVETIQKLFFFLEDSHREVLQALAVAEEEVRELSMPGREKSRNRWQRVQREREKLGKFPVRVSE